MTVSAAILARLAALNMPAEAFREVLAIVAEVQSSYDDLRSVDDARREASRLASKKYRENKRGVTSPSDDASYDAKGGYPSIPPRLSLFQEEEEKNSLPIKKEGVKETARASFDLFWEMYPNKVGKKDAERKFIAIAKSGVVTFDELMAGLDRYVHKADDRPWCNPATWLNQHRWTDKPAQVTNGRSLLAATERIIDQLGGREAARDYVPGSAGPKPLDLVSGQGQLGFRRLPPR